MLLIAVITSVILDALFLEMRLQSLNDEWTLF